MVIGTGSTLFLHTLGTASTTTVGWAQLHAGPSVAAYAIFTQRVNNQAQSGTATAATAGSRILVPFDNTRGSVTSLAIVNPTGASESISVGIGTGAPTPPPPAINLPANGHMAFRFPDQFAGTYGQTGVAEFYSASGNFSILALIFNTGAFTTAPVYAVEGPPLIASSANSSPGNIVFARFSIGKLIMPDIGGEGDVIQGYFANYSPAGWAALQSEGEMFGPCPVLDLSPPPYNGSFSADQSTRRGCDDCSKWWQPFTARLYVS